MLWKRFSRPKLKNRKPSTDRERKSSDNKRLRSDPVNRTLQTTPKRKAFDTATNQGRVKKKRKMRDDNGVDERTNTVDRISELPDPIIQHILSFLRCPKDVTRTSVLSKKWRSTYASFLSFDFDQKRFKAPGGGEVQQAEFKRFVESSLSTRIAPLIWIQKFRLHITSFGPKMARHIDRWLCAATTKNVKELEISVERKRRLRYSVPQIVLAAHTLTSLKLYGSPKLQEAKLYFESSRKAVSKGRIEGHIPLWMVNLQEFLGLLNQSKNLNLVVRHKKDMLISEDLEGIELPLDHDLKLEISNPSTKLEDLLDSLLRITHPETLSVVSPSDSEFLKLLHDKMMNREENPACCRYYSRKCWLHYLKDVKTGDSLTSALRRRDSSSTLYKTAAFKLEWTAR
ncbi:putative FBD-associated F-box protein At5g22720 isoform X3 [Rhododendron vialii]|uniref:putative FBD-associated F-box protein At5g22720 isoform X3 n=1 Tax=Rhododendron vialii TaxID=182163 RepID=UPI0026600480|nr:putative FBD-associated F-box protein At5g22720 isoform X3 [Rhododendron vialii]